MSLSLVQSRVLLGLQAPAVTVEVHLANGLPSFTLVGLAQVEVKEARVRRNACRNAQLRKSTAYGRIFGRKRRRKRRNCFAFGVPAAISWN